jgi:primosomal protein N' (replication factor Y)
MKILTVIPFEKASFREDLTYFSAKDVAPGSIVKVTLRSKTLLGVVLSEEDASGAKGALKELDFNLKKILEVKENSVFRSEYMKAILDTSEYFLARKNDGASALIPSVLKEEYDKIIKWIESDDEEKKIVKQNPDIRTEKLLLQTDFENRISFYKTLIRGNFAEKKSIFIVLPTEAEVKNFENLLSKGIEQFTFSFSGTLKSKKSLDKLKEMLTVEHPVLIIGTPQYLSLPRFDFKTIILESERSNAYKMQHAPYFDLRIFVEIFTSLLNARFIMADTLLRFETYARKELDDFAEISPLSFRRNFEGEIEMVQRETERNKRSFSVLTETNLNSIKEMLEKKENVFVFALRKGLATYTICRDCNDIVLCEACGAPVVLYLSRDGKKRIFTCNRCQNEKDPDTKCGLCGSWNLLPLGIGTDTVYEELKANFPDTKIWRLDKSVVSSTKEAIKVVEEFEAHKGGILLGTQLALFYLKNKVAYSVIASFDTLWSIPNFLMGEKIIELFFTFMEKTKKKILIISKNINDPALLAIKNENLLSFVRNEINDRKTLGYPPYKRFIKITHTGTKEEALEVKKFYQNLFEEYEIDIFGNISGTHKVEYNTNVLIKLDRKNWSLPTLSLGGRLDQNLLNKINTLPKIFKICIDPENLL